MQVIWSPGFIASRSRKASRRSLRPAGVWHQNNGLSELSRDDPQNEKGARRRNVRFLI